MLASRLSPEFLGSLRCDSGVAHSPAFKPLNMPESTKMVKFTENSEEEKGRNGAIVPNDEASGISTPIEEFKAPDSAKKEGKDKRRRRKAKAGQDGEQPRKKKTRRNSLSKAPRDPRDGVDSPIEQEVGTRSPSPVIDFDGLSKPSENSHD